MADTRDQSAILILIETHSDKDEAGPLTSPMGYVYRKWLKQAGIDPRHCDIRPVVREATTLKRALVKGKDGGIPGLRYVQRGYYLAAKYERDVQDLWSYINRTQPNLILACGDLALWAVTAETSLKSARGRITRAKANLDGRKVLPTYSPQQIMADYSLRPIFLADAGKAARESLFPEIRRPQRFVHIPESIADIEEFVDTYIADRNVELSVDIETKGRMITCVGFAVDWTRSLVIPFYDELASDGNYWPFAKNEFEAWQWVKRLLRHPSFGQNFQYDMHYLWREVGIPSPGFCDDTMLLHHALQPELQKGLGFLASIYTDELSWKGMHKIASNDRTAKKGDLE